VASGDVSSLTVTIDHSKLHFHVHQTDFSAGHDSMSAKYDGEEFEFGDTYTKTGDWYVVDREGNKLSVEPTFDEQEPQNDQPATVGRRTANQAIRTVVRAK